MMLRFFWGPRPETSEECAKRILKHWKVLEQIHPQFSKPWFLTEDIAQGHGYSPLEPTLEAMASELEDTISYKYVPRNEPMLDLGFRIRMTCVDEQPELLKMQANMELSCGCSAKRVPNSMMFYASDVEGSGDVLHAVDGAISLITALVDSWDPDVGQAHWSCELADAIEQGKDDIQVGWLTYLPEKKLTFPIEDAPGRVVELPGKGAIFVAVDAPFEKENPKHIAAVKQVLEFVNQRS